MSLIVIGGGVVVDCDTAVVAVVVAAGVVVDCDDVVVVDCDDAVVVDCDDGNVVVPAVIPFTALPVVKVLLVKL